MEKAGRWRQGTLSLCSRHSTICSPTPAKSIRKRPRELRKTGVMREAKTARPLFYIYLLFFLSGISGLVYEIIWARQLGLVFGNTDYGVATTLSAFMFGLGIGSLIIGYLSDKYLKTASHLLITYCLMELSIGILGVGTIWIIPHLDSLSILISSYEASPTAGGLIHLSPSTNAWRLVISFLLLTPPSFLMGGTLPLLSKLVSSNRENVGRQIGYLFMFNTLGAALGCFLTDYAGIRIFGVLRTGGIAGALNMLVTAMAWLLLKQNARQTRRIVKEELSDDIPRPDKWGVNKQLFTLATAAFAIGGFSGMALEVIWFRSLGSYLLGYRAVLSSVLTIVLLGFVVGSYVSSRLISERRSPLFHFSLSQVFLGLTALVTIFCINILDYSGVVDWIVASVSSEPIRYQAGYAFCLITVALVVAIPSFFMGWAFPLINAFCQMQFKAVGSQVGRLYMFNTLGAVAGSLMQGFILTPYLGIQKSLMLVSGILILSGTFLLWRQNESFWVKVVAVATVAVLGFWSLLPEHFLMDRYSFHSGSNMKVAYRHEGKNESILVLESQNGSFRSLKTNGFSMSDTSYGARRYMKLMAHLPLLIHENPRRALIIAYGIGNTTYAVSLHDSLERIDVVDLSEDILSISNYFSATNMRVLENPRVRAFVNDGRHHLIMSGGNYDLITSEPPPLPFAYTVNLYTEDYYERVYQNLSERGFFTQWLPIFQLNQDVVKSGIKAFVNIFPNSMLVSGYRSQLILIGSPGEFQLDAERVGSKLDSNIALKRDLASISAGSVTEIFGSFVMGKRGLRAYTAGVDPLTDDHPFMEYSKTLHYLSSQDSRIYDRMDEVWSYLVKGDVPILESYPTLRDYLAVMAIIYHSRAFLESSDARVKMSTFERLQFHYRTLLMREYRSRYLEHFLGNAMVQDLRR